VCAGVVSGAGKQLSGALIVFLTYYIFAVPLALGLGFYTSLWVYGLYLGLSVGPFLQAILYMLLIWRIDWVRESESAAGAAARS
jgi:multidrug resistance protein, MATE family